jgi:chromate transporter
MPDRESFLLQDEGETSGDAEPAHHPPVSLLGLFLVCLQIGLFSFGGGLSGWINQEVVVRRRWMSEDEFLGGLALCQVMPGINVTNLIVYIGQRVRGVPGALVGLVGLVIGPFFVVIGLVAIYERVAGVPWLQAAFDGMAAAAVGLLLLVGFKGVQRVGRRPSAALVIAAIVITVGILQWPLVPVVLVMAPVSVALAWSAASHAR